MGQPGERPDVELDLVALPVDVELVERPARAEAGVVDDQVDGIGGIGDACGDEILASPRAEVGGEHLDAVELAGERLQPIDAPGHDDDRHSGRGELACQLLADPAGRAGDERRA